MFKTKKNHNWNEPLIKTWSYKRSNLNQLIFLDSSCWWLYYNAFSLSQKNLKTLLSLVYDFSTTGLYKDILNHLRRHCRTAWTPCWGLLVSRQILRQHQHQEVAMWPGLLEVIEISLENRFSCMNKPFQEWQELCTEFTSYPRMLWHCLCSS